MKIKQTFLVENATTLCYCRGGCYGHYCLNYLENYENETHLLKYMLSKHILIQKLLLNCVEVFNDYERIVCSVFVFTDSDTDNRKQYAGKKKVFHNFRAIVKSTLLALWASVATAHVDVRLGWKRVTQ